MPKKPGKRWFTPGSGDTPPHNSNYSANGVPRSSIGRKFITAIIRKWGKGGRGGRNPWGSD